MDAATYKAFREAIAAEIGAQITQHEVEEHGLGNGREGETGHFRPNVVSDRINADKLWMVLERMISP